MMDWTLVGQGVGGILIGVGAYFAGRKGREVTEARQDAEVDVVQLMRAELERLAKRVQNLEARDVASRARIHQLERLLVKMGIELPPEPSMHLPATATGD